MSPALPKPELELICLSCGEHFYSTRSWAKFCSTKCRNNFNNDKKYIEKGELPKIKCPHCKTDDLRMFELLSSNHSSTSISVKHYFCNVCTKEFFLE
jgi:hypothetical protein